MMQETPEYTKEVVDLQGETSTKKDKHLFTQISSQIHQKLSSSTCQSIPNAMK